MLSNIFELKRENDRKSEDCIAFRTKDCAAFAHMHLILKGWNQALLLITHTCYQLLAIEIMTMAMSARLREDITHPREPSPRSLDINST